jgi:hypothetical protein
MDPGPDLNRSRVFQQAGAAITSEMLKAPHQALMVHYVRLLKEVSSLHLITGRGKREEFFGRDLFVWRGLVRLFVEAHIRRQLLALRDAYALQQSIAPATLSSEDKWFEEAQKSSEKLLAAISSWHRLKLALATITPVLAGVIIARLGVDSIYDAAVRVTTSKEFRASTSAFLTNYILLVYFLLAIMYLLLPVMMSFRYKRRMFFPGAWYQEIPNWQRRQETRKQAKKGKPPFPQGANVYEVENELFATLEVRKPREPYVDIMVTLCVMLAGAAGWTFYLTRTTDQARAYFFYPTFLLGLLLAFVIGETVYRAAHRKWR